VSPLKSCSLRGPLVCLLHRAAPDNITGYNIMPELIVINSVISMSCYVLQNTYFHYHNRQLFTAKKISL
jgi:hypothetical protein